MDVKEGYAKKTYTEANRWVCDMEAEEWVSVKVHKSVKNNSEARNKH